MEKKAANRKVRKSIAIIGEGLTEYRYVDDMRTTERYRFSLVPGIPKHSDVDDIVRLAQERLGAGFDYVLCLIDMDVKHEVLGEVCDDEEFGDNCNRDCQHFCNGTCKATPMRDVFGDLWHVLASKETMNQ